MNDSRGQSTYGYDAVRRLTTVTNSKGKLVQYVYDDIGHLVTLTYPDGRTVTYGYDAAGRLSTALDWAARSTGYGYDGAGNLASIMYPNGAISSYAYDNANRLVAITNRVDARTLSSFTYTLDSSGNRVQMTDAAGGINGYQYDALNRLTSWTAPSGQKTSYLYDRASNRTSVTTSAGTTNSTFDDADRLLTAGSSVFTYDGNGNRLTKTGGGSTTTYSFDSLNRLTGVLTGSSTAQFEYDGDGNRIGVVNAGIRADYVLDVKLANPSVLSETGANGNVDYEYGGSLLLASAPAYEQFYQPDGMGSTASVTDTTDALKAGYSYDPWGRMINPVDPLGLKNPFKFTGEALDSSSGLYYLRARYYDPTVGRFISADPFAGSLRLPMTTNRYVYARGNPLSYVDNNPLSYVDKSGLSAEPSGTGPYTRALAARSSNYAVSVSTPSAGGRLVRPVGRLWLDQAWPEDVRPSGLLDPRVTMFTPDASGDLTVRTDIVASGPGFMSLDLAQSLDILNATTELSEAYLTAFDYVGMTLATAGMSSWVTGAAGVATDLALGKSWEEAISRAVVGYIEDKSVDLLGPVE
jgi:RHS repeat-associated protein